MSNWHITGQHLSLIISFTQEIVANLNSVGRVP